MASFHSILSNVLLFTRSTKLTFRLNGLFDAVTATVGLLSAVARPALLVKLDSA